MSKKNITIVRGQIFYFKDSASLHTIDPVASRYPNQSQHVHHEDGLLIILDFGHIAKP